MRKSTLAEIEARFDKDVDRFSNLETGQAATVDAVANMELITQSISRIYPHLSQVLDIGCGAGNYDIKLLEYLTVKPHFTLVDLSQPMLNAAKQRLQQHGCFNINTLKGDFRTIALHENKFDVIIATAVLHHLRDDDDWLSTFKHLYTLLREGGSLWVFDLVHQTEGNLQKFIYQEQYGTYLTTLKDQEYRDQVFAYIEKEDSPRPLMYQLNLLQKIGFKNVDVLHKNLCFASYVAFK